MSDPKKTELSEEELDQVAGAGKHEYRERVSFSYGPASTGDEGQDVGKADKSGIIHMDEG